MTWVDDDELRARFHELREDDRARAASFRAVLARRPARRGLQGRSVVGAAVIAIAASVILAIGIARNAPRDGGRFVLVGHSTTSQFAPQLSEWVPPTTSLLSTPGRELLAPPPIGRSALVVLDAPTLTSGGAP